MNDTNTQEWRREWLNPPTLYVDRRRVNFDDLIHSFTNPGVIVRCDGDPRECIMPMESSSQERYEFVAGMVSDEA